MPFMLLAAKSLLPAHTDRKLLPRQPWNPRLFQVPGCVRHHAISFVLFVSGRYTLMHSAFAADSQITNCRENVSVQCNNTLNMCMVSGFDRKYGSGNQFCQSPNCHGFYFQNNGDRPEPHQACCRIAPQPTSAALLAPEVHP